MNKEILENINDLFDSYDLFGSNTVKIRDRIKTRFPDITEETIKETELYIKKEFGTYCVKYADIIAEKYKTPFLPKSDEAQQEIGEYVKECKKKYPYFDEKKNIEIFSAVCWLANR